MAAGTENRTYAMGCSLGKSPLGPFAPQKNNPILRSTSGLITGTGHGCIEDDLSVERRHSGHVDDPGVDTLVCKKVCCIERAVDQDTIGYDCDIAALAQDLGRERALREVAEQERDALRRRADDVQAKAETLAADAAEQIFAT